MSIRTDHSANLPFNSLRTAEQMWVDFGSPFNVRTNRLRVPCHAGLCDIFEQHPL